MFFIGIFGTDSKVVPLGQISPLVCPVCGATAPMNLCRRYQYFHFFFLPLVKFNSLFLVTCPGCASVFSLDPEKGKEILKGAPATVVPGDLTLMKNNLAPRCPRCGQPLPKDSSFCNKCGAPL